MTKHDAICPEKNTKLSRCENILALSETVATTTTLRYLHFLSIFFLSASVYDDIIKLTIEHLTFTLVPWESLANRKINIHSCIQRTWLLLCEFYTFFCIFRWIQEGGKTNYSKVSSLLPARHLLLLAISFYVRHLYSAEAVARVVEVFLRYDGEERDALPHGSFNHLQNQQISFRSLFTFNIVKLHLMAPREHFTAK